MRNPTVLITLLSIGAGLPSAAQQTPQLLVDLYPADDETFFSPTEWQEVGGRLIFTSPGLGQGFGELWISDGTADGTGILSDLTPGSRGSAISDLERLGDRLAFLANTPDLGTEIWFSDGTAAGTAPLADFCLGTCSVQVRDLEALGDQLFFLRTTPADGEEVWRSDGTVEGTRIFLSMADGETDDADEDTHLTRIGGLLYWTSPSLKDEGSRLLWASDGTVDGTHLVTRLAAAPSGLPLGLDGNRAILQLPVSEHASQIWATDGTSAGTFPLAEIGDPDDLPGPVGQPVAQGGRFLFRVTFTEPTTKSERSEIWTTDGTPAGTRKAVDLAAFFVGSGSPSRSFSNSSMAVFRDRVYFDFDDGTHGNEPWTSDGTPGGTHLLRDIVPGFTGSLPTDFQAIGDVLTFVAAANENFNTKLFRSDGTAEGTSILLDTDQISTVARLCNSILVTSIEGDFESFTFTKTDGTREGTSTLLFLGEAGSSLPSSLIRLGDEVFFGAREPQTAFDMHKTDGTVGGTSTFPFLTAFLPTYYDAVVRDGDHIVWQTSSHLYRTTSNLEESVRLDVDLALSSDLADQRRFTSYLGQVYFAGFGEHGEEPWVTDGTPAGTHQIADLFPGMDPHSTEDFEIGNSSVPRLFTPLRNRIFFTAGNDIRGRELWATDGSAAGTRVFDAIPGPEGADPVELLPLRDRLFFAGDDLWVTDGTSRGTHRVELPELEASRPRSLLELRGRCVFKTGSPPEPSRLWITDGSPEGTRMLFEAPPNGFNIGELAVSGSLLYFSTPATDTGWELWLSDGTAEGTRMLRDILPGPAGSLPKNLTPVDGALLFAASDGTTGHELWATDGTGEGTRFLGEINPGPAGSMPFEATPVGETVVFTAYRRDTGRELFTIDRSLLLHSCVPSDTRLCLQGGRFEVEVEWRNQRNGSTGRGHALSYSEDTGLFWFFNEQNVELIVKNLDGRGRNGHHWSFYGGLSDVDYWITLTDTRTGRSRSFHNPAGEICGDSDTRAFSDLDFVPDFAPRPGTGESLADPPGSTGLSASVSEGAPSEAAAGGECAPGSGALVLRDGRFAVEVFWRNQRNGRTGIGTPVPRTDESGTFWFFRPENLELVVKLLDGTVNNGHFWFFFGALSDVEYEIRVTDTASCQQKVYRNPPGQICGQADLFAYDASGASPGGP